MIHSLVVGDQQELSFNGKPFYSGPTLSLLATFQAIYDAFPSLSMEDARYLWLQAEKETVQNDVVLRGSVRMCYGRII